jgi:hypothetical protein
VRGTVSTLRTPPAVMPGHATPAAS